MYNKFVYEFQFVLVLREMEVQLLWKDSLEPYPAASALPIIREGDDIAKIVADSVLSAAKSDSFSIGDRDVIAVTEAVVAVLRETMLLQNRLRQM